MESSQNIQVPSLGLTWRERITSALIPSSFDKGLLYVPWKDILLLTDAGNVSQAERELLGFEDIHDYERKVDGRRRILCTLIYARLTHKFLSICDNPNTLKNRPLQDDDLPEVPRDGREVDLAIRVWRSSHDFSGWTQTEMDDFYDSQWKFFVPIFNWPFWDSFNTGNIPIQYDAVYHPRTVFPFDPDEEPTSTAFSRIWKIKIHTSHINEYDATDHPYPSDEFVALKESFIDVVTLETHTGIQEAPNEREIHFQLSRIKHIFGDTDSCALYSLHLVKLYWTFRRQQNYYMIFPWAEGGSLVDLWRVHEPKDFDEIKLQEWMEVNIIGLLGALRLLHEMGCSHGDLKPDNILIYSQPETLGQQYQSYHFCWVKDPAKSKVSLPRKLGILKINDFGTARYSSDATTARSKDASVLTGAQRYAPPEFDRSKPARRSPRSRLYDIWSMGGIILEFIIWACCGRKSLIKFRSELENPYPARFWIHGDNNQKFLHPIVKQIFSNLKTILNGNGTSRERPPSRLKKYLLELLEVVQTKMLVVNISETNLANQKLLGDSSTDNQRESLCRATAKTLHQQLYKLDKGYDKESNQDEDPEGFDGVQSNVEFVQRCLTNRDYPWRWHGRSTSRLT